MLLQISAWKGYMKKTVRGSQPCTVFLQVNPHNKANETQKGLFYIRDTREKLDTIWSA